MNGFENTVSFVERNFVNFSGKLIGIRQKSQLNRHDTFEINNSSEVTKKNDLKLNLNFDSFFFYSLQ